MPKILDCSLCEVCENAVYVDKVDEENFVECTVDSNQTAQLPKHESCEDFVFDGED